MEIKQLIFFQSIVKYNSFTEAAEACGISQSGISQQIHSLEKELGVNLFERDNKKFKITEAGEHLYKKSIVLLEYLDIMQKEVIKIGKKTDVHLKIGYLKNYGGCEFFSTLEKFAKKYPDVKISIVSGTHEELYQALKSDKVDLTFIDKRREGPTDYVNLFIKNVNTYIETVSYSEISHLKSIDINDLKSSPCIIVSSEKQREQEQAYYHDIVGFNGIFSFTESVHEGRMLVAANQGILPLDINNIKETKNNSIKHIKLLKNGIPVTKNYYVFWKKENSDFYIEEFANLLKSEFN